MLPKQARVSLPQLSANADLMCGMLRMSGAIRAIRHYVLSRFKA
jgi:hypothetical protein